MASIIYKFATSPDAAGRTVTVKDARTHATVTSGSFSNSADETGVVTYRPTLEEGDYYGEFTVPGVPGLEGEKHPVRTRRVDAVLDVPGSIAAGGGTPTADTAFLIATGPAIATDGAFHVETLVWDDRYPQVDWITVDAGSGTIPDGAGNCTIGIIAGASADFSGTTPPDDPGTIGGQVGFFVNNSSLVGSAFTEALGDGQDVQSLGTAPLTFATDPTDFDPGDMVTVKGKVYAFSDVDQVVPIDDGAATVTIAVAITRGGSAPTLPD